MTIGVSEALDMDTGIVLTIKRETGGGYIDGLWVTGTFLTFKTIGSPQPASAKELQILPEGDRDKDVFKFITKKPLRALSDRDNISADIVIFKGAEYTIISQGDWDIFGQTTSFGARTK